MGEKLEHRFGGGAAGRKSLLPFSRRILDFRPAGIPDFWLQAGRVPRLPLRPRLLPEPATPDAAAGQLDRDARRCGGDARGMSPTNTTHRQAAHGLPQRRTPGAGFHSRNAGILHLMRGDPRTTEIQAACHLVVTRQSGPARTIYHGVEGRR